MRDPGARAMDEGALGVESALVYAPAFYAKTEELIALSRGAAGRRHVHLAPAQRGLALLEAVDELITIAREAACRRDLPPQGRGPGELGQDRRRHRAGSSRRAGGPARHRGHVPLHRRRDRAQRARCRRGCRRAASRPGGRAQRAGRPRARRAEMTAARTAGRTCSVCRAGGRCGCSRLPLARAAAAHRQDARRGRGDARDVARGDRDGPGGRGRHPRQHRVLHSMTEENVRRSCSCRG